MNKAAHLDDLISRTLLADAGHQDPLTDSLDVLRRHLQMDVAYLSEFVGDRVVFRGVASAGQEGPIVVGATMPIDRSYCDHVRSGRLPELVLDTYSVPFCGDIAWTDALPIKSYICVPVIHGDGSPYGMLCCLGHQEKPDLNDRDLAITRAFAASAGEQINEDLSLSLSLRDLRDTIEVVIRDRSFDIVYQPIKTTDGQTILGFESLCRFHFQPYRAPNLWFDDAFEVGLQSELEVAVIRKALAALAIVDPTHIVAVNVSPDTVTTGLLTDAFASYDCTRIVLEITENSVASDYQALLEEVSKLRDLGVVIAIDDAGGGYAGLQHIVKMKPDIIKLDIALTTSIDTDIVRRSLAVALVRFAQEIDAQIVAEGVETREELDALRALGVTLAQGHFLARPAPIKTFALVAGVADASSAGNC